MDGRLDPFAGSNQDPQSFHKYLFGNADPIQHVDPTGQSAALAFWTLAVIGIYSYIGWRLLAPHSHAQWANPLSWSARAVGPLRILFASYAYQYHQQRLSAGSLMFSDLSLGAEAALDPVFNPIYADADMNAIFSKFASLYPHVNTVLCDDALDNFVVEFKPWVEDHPDKTKGIVFLNAVFKRIPWGAAPDQMHQDDNILILLPTRYYNEIKANHHLMANPSWYDTAEKRSILYFYPASWPPKPVGRVYERYLSELTADPAPNDHDVPRLWVDPEGDETFIKP